MKYNVLFFMLLCVSCNWAEEKTKQTVNKAGEVVAKTGSEFADGIKKGVEKTFQNTIQVSDVLMKKGIKTGKVLIVGEDNNILSVYLIFENNVDQQVTVKLSDENDLEYGRVTQVIKGQKDEAKYIDFVFEKRTHINGKSKVRID